MAKKLTEKTLVKKLESLSKKELQDIIVCLRTRKIFTI